MPSDIGRQRKPRSTCASAQSDQAIHCPLIESFDITECTDREQRTGRCFAHVLDHVNPHILRMFEYTFSIGVAHFVTVKITAPCQSEPYSDDYAYIPSASGIGSPDLNSPDEC